MKDLGDILIRGRLYAVQDEMKDLGDILIRGRLYAVLERAQRDSHGEVVYELHGPRGARWRTMRNAHHPEMMFLVNSRGSRSSQMMDGVWLTDRKGEGRLEVHSQ